MAAIDGFRPGGKHSTPGRGYAGSWLVPGCGRVWSGGNSKASRLLDSLLAPQRVSAAR